MRFKVCRLKCLLFIYIVFFICNFAPAQPDLQISLLSCSPGNELYSTFGHSAIRMKDLNSDKDYVFNYGTFNFQEKNFYLKFCQGKLNYLLTMEPMDDFLYSYRMENRTVYEQILNLTRDQKTQLFYALQFNALPPNRAYKYDFFWDNCSTRIRDQFDRAFHDSIQYPVQLNNHLSTFRDYLHKYLVDQPWSRFGIDLILGLPADAVAHTREAMFLPLEMMQIYDSTTVNNKPTNSKSKVLQTAIVQPPQKTWCTPLLMSALLLILIMMAKWVFTPSVITRILFNLVMIIVGIAGLIIFFLWFISEHTTTDQNLHFIWANPVLLLYPLRKKIFSTPVVIWLSRIYIFLLMMLLMLFPFNPQAMPGACILIWISIMLIVSQDAQFNFSNLPRSMILKKIL